MFIILTYETPEGQLSINLTLYQVELCALHLTFDQLSAYLFDSYGVTANPRTLKRRFQNWGVRRRLPTYVAERLEKRIQILLFNVGEKVKGRVLPLQKDVPVAKRNILGSSFVNIGYCLWNDQNTNTMISLRK
jgi:hypothetical protein